MLNVNVQLSMDRTYEDLLATVGTSVVICTLLVSVGKLITPCYYFPVIILILLLITGSAGAYNYFNTPHKRTTAEIFWQDDDDESSSIGKFLVSTTSVMKNKLINLQPPKLNNEYGFPLKRRTSTWAEETSKKLKGIAQRPMTLLAEKQGLDGRPQSFIYRPLSMFVTPPMFSNVPEEDENEDTQLSRSSESLCVRKSETELASSSPAEEGCSSNGAREQKGDKEVLGALKRKCAEQGLCLTRYLEGELEHFTSLRQRFHLTSSRGSGVENCGVCINEPE